MPAVGIDVYLIGMAWLVIFYDRLQQAETLISILSML